MLRLRVINRHVGLGHHAVILEHSVECCVAHILTNWWGVRIRACRDVNDAQVDEIELVGEGKSVGGKEIEAT